MGLAALREKKAYIDKTKLNPAARDDTLRSKDVLGYYRNLGSLRYGTSTASCKDAYGKIPFFS